MQQLPFKTCTFRIKCHMSGIRYVFTPLIHHIISMRENEFEPTRKCSERHSYGDGGLDDAILYFGVNHHKTQLNER